jgi:hypothetical protein
MTYSRAVEILRDADLLELKDQGFGDVELTWVNPGGEEIAGGYLGHDNYLVMIREPGGDYSRFEGETALNLSGKYRSKRRTFNR